MNKKIVISYLIGTVFTAWSLGVHAAQVDIYTPAGVNPLSYQINGVGETYSMYSNLTNADNSALVDPSSNGGSELVFLGLHTPFELDGGFSESNAVEVNVFNDTLGDVTTGAVSLVLTAAAAVNWTINVEAGVQLENIFVFTRNETTLTNTLINVFDVASDNSSSASLLSPQFAGEFACGYQLPYAEGGCDTNLILGIVDPDLGIVLANLLADLTPNGVNGVTNFNGTYYSNQFDVHIDSVGATVVPVPAAAILFLSALSLVPLGIRRQ